MTGLEKIIISIENDAQKEYEHKLDLCRKKCDGLLLDADKKASAEYENILSDAKKEASYKKESTLSSAKRDFSASVLEIKTNAISDVIRTAKEAFVNSDELFNKAFEVFIKKCPVKEGELYITSRDKNRLNKTNQKLISNFKINTKCAFDCGFSVTAGNVTQNYSVDAVFEKEKDNLWDMLSKILFS